MNEVRFEWDDNKTLQNLEKHEVSFNLAQYAFSDPNRVIAELKNGITVLGKLEIEF